jgi:hypothetical protein
MTNPYYIPYETPASSFSNALQNTLGLGMQMYGLKQRGRLAEIEQNLENKRLNESIRQHDFSARLGERQAAIGERNAATAEQHNVIMKQNAAVEAAKLPTYKQNFGMGDVTALKSGLQAKGLDKAFEPIMAPLETMAKDANVDKLSAMTSMSNNWSFYRDKLVDGLSKDYQSKSTKDPLFAQSPEGKEILKTIDAFSNTDDTGNLMERQPDGTVITKGNVVRDVFFSNTWSSYASDMASKRVLASYDQAVAEKVRSGELSPEKASTLIHPRTEPTYTPSFKGGYTGTKGEALTFDERTGKYFLSGTDTPYLGKVKTPQENVKEIHFEKPEKTKYQAVNVTLDDGSIVAANFNPATGKYHDPESGAVLKIKARAGTGGKPEDPERQAIKDKLLGKPAAAVPPAKVKSYKTADEVKADFQAGKLDKAKALQILQKQFGYK